MLATKSLCSLAVALLLFPTAAIAESVRPHLSSDPRVNAARSLIDDGRFDAALSVLRPMAPDHADDRTDVLFLTGLAALRASQRLQVSEKERTALLDEAVAAFRAILVHRPRLVRVRLELAQAFFLKGDDDLARDHFERVLAGKPAAAIAANIHRFLNTIRARRRWTAHFGFALAPDSNINFASETEIIHIHDRPFRRDADTGARSGVGGVLWGGGEYQYPLDERFRLRAGADVARREYAGKDFDQTFLSTHAGPRWLASATTEVSLLVSARHRWTAGESQSREFGARFESEHRLSRRLTAYGRASWHWREYPQNEILDGRHFSLSFGGIWLIAPTARTDVAAGYAHERPQSLVWRNTDRWARLGVSFALPLGFTVGTSGELHWTKYRGRWFPFTPDSASREDRIRILRASVFNRAYTVYGFSPQLVLVNEARESNAQLYDYRRNRAELRFVRQF